MKFSLIPALVGVAVSSRLRGDCTTGGGPGCIVTLALDKVQPLSPATITTSIGSNGFITAQASAGEMPDYEAAPENQETDVAMRFTITSPALDMPPAPPPLIACSYEQCTTSTTTLNPAFR